MQIASWEQRARGPLLFLSCSLSIQHPFFSCISDQWMKVENMQVRAANGVCVWVPLPPRRRCSDTALGVDARRLWGISLRSHTRHSLSIASWKRAACREWCRPPPPPQLRLRQLWFFVGLMGQMHSEHTHSLHASFGTVSHAELLSFFNYWQINAFSEGIGKIFLFKYWDFFSN
jgi:hypothetical protein